MRQPFRWYNLISKRAHRDLRTNQRPYPGFLGHCMKARGPVHTVAIAQSKCRHPQLGRALNQRLRW